MTTSFGTGSWNYLIPTRKAHKTMVRQSRKKMKKRELKPMVPKGIGAPSKEEVRQHMVNHIPFRAW